MSGPERDLKTGPSPSATWEAPTLVRPAGPPPPDAAEGTLGVEGVELGDVPPLLIPGHPLAGRYTVLDKLGQGGMGVVVAAYDSRLDRRVALKVLRHSLKAEGSEGEETRLVREA